MIKLDIKSELPLAAKWTNEHTKQLAYSVSNALNTTVQGSKFVAGSKQKSALNALAGSSRRYLDRPKPQTQKGFRAIKSNKRTLRTVVLPKDKPYNQTRYLTGNILGGARRAKYDAAFVRHPKAVNMPSGAKLVPTGYFDRYKDKYGNIRKGTIGKLLNSVGTGNRTGNNIFIGKPTGGNRPAGVYKRERNYVLRPLFIARSTVTYDPKFPAKSIVEKNVQRNFGMYLRYELAKNVRNKVKQGGADLRTGLF
jgi:hypothetical protein